ncbi:RagB/SusD family nutrient uptake outer membrane protein [Olivibacter sp. SDN3]|uniref:RagB/SusD family nutrient uptake outer membrane protein n=1 Tax=Olivibacter sp. SDN3 TaxID=2764720 RepID=UPI0016517747|nr:RagB/SusD family nutrient uptake outer membrane protein [Olivibacter sp. SDN3]QNL51574.1 RagB/SusD family nutrient uptake outer membrane protein [Olivibacter sp. SDN3]
MKKILNILLIVGISSTMTACNKLLDVDPTQSIDSNTALESEEAINAALHGVYSRLREVGLYGRDLIAIPELLSDNAVNTGAGNRLVGQGINQAGAHIQSGTWQYAYYINNQANLILEALQDFEADQAYKDNIAAQLYFLRALVYHDLMKAYAYDPTAIVEPNDRGGVPIINTGVLNTEQIEYTSRPTVVEVYDFIYSQLDQAIALFPGNAIGDQIFASLPAAHALYSRVALYRGDMAKVISEGELAISTSNLRLADTEQFVNTWRTAKNPESFFEVAFVQPADHSNATNESLRSSFTTRMTAESNTAVSHGNVVVSDELYAAYEENDVRRELIMRGLSGNSSRWEITKFVSRSEVNNIDNVPVIRLPEVILNMAEAYATPGSTVLNEQAAREQLNLIRERAGIDATNADGQALFDDIILQRRLELAFEGHRFFDLKRLGRDIFKESGNIQHTDFRILANIPVREAVPNTQVEQNVGY